ncbi:hypothetical protein KFU94_23095 [Chloroflexi bacterium TSY]|nr:hypothetical protein [Chloroflexi bacterium TSY]
MKLNAVFAMYCFCLISLFALAGCLQIANTAEQNDALEEYCRECDCKKNRECRKYCSRCRATVASRQSEEISPVIVFESPPDFIITNGGVFCHCEPEENCDGDIKACPGIFEPPITESLAIACPDYAKDQLAPLIQVYSEDFQTHIEILPEFDIQNISQTPLNEWPNVILTNQYLASDFEDPEVFVAFYNLYDIQTTEDLQNVQSETIHYSFPIWEAGLENQSDTQTSRISTLNIGEHDKIVASLHLAAYLNSYVDWEQLNEMNPNLP